MAVTTQPSRVMGGGFQNCGAYAPAGVGHDWLCMSGGDTSAFFISSDGITYRPCNKGLYFGRHHASGIAGSQTVANRIYVTISTSNSGGAGNGVMMRGTYSASTGLVTWTDNFATGFAGAVTGGFDRPRHAGRHFIALDEANGWGYACSDNGLWRINLSTGAATQRALNGCTLRAVVLDPDDPTVGWVAVSSGGAGAGVYRCTNLPSGTVAETRKVFSWANDLTYLDTGTNQYLYAALGGPTQNGGVQRWNVGPDITTGWTDLSGDLNLTANGVACVDAAFSAGKILLVAGTGGNANNQNGGAWSRDGGTTWVNQTDPGWVTNYVPHGETSTWWLLSFVNRVAIDQNTWDAQACQFNPNDPTQMIWWGRSGAWSSRNGGGTVKPALRGICASFTHTCIAHPSGPMALVGDTDWTSFKLGGTGTNQGVDGIDNTDSLVQVHQPASGATYGVAFSSDGGTAGIAGEYGDVYVSTNFSAANPTWTAQGFSGAATAEGLAIGEDVGGSRIVMTLKSGTAIFRKVGSGAPANVGGPSGGGAQVAHFCWPNSSDSSRNTAVYCSAATGLYRSLNRGGSWSQLFAYSNTSENTGNIFADPSNPDTLYLSRNDGLYKVTNASGSASITHIGPTVTAAGPCAVDPTNGVVYLVVTGDNAGGTTLWASPSNNPGAATTFTEVADEQFKSGPFYPVDACMTVTGKLLVVTQQGAGYVSATTTATNPTVVTASATSGFSFGGTASATIVAVFPAEGVERALANATATTAAATSLSVTPTGMIIGDLLVAEYGTVGLASTHTAPAGWQQVGPQVSGSGGTQFTVWRKPVTSAAEAGPYSFTTPGGSSMRMALAIRAFIGADPDTPIESEPATQFLTNVNSLTHASLPIGGPNRIWVLATAKRTATGVTSNFDPPRLVNTLEGGAAAVGVTTGNSGLASGSAWDAVVTNGGSTAAYTTTAAHDTRAVTITPAASAQTYLVWTATHGSNVYGSCSVRLTGYPASGLPLALVRVVAADGTTLAGVNIDNAGHIATVRTGGTVHATGTTAVVPLNTWVRVEWHFALSAAAGTVEAKVFLTVDATAAAETLSAVGTADTSGTPSQYRMGMCVSRTTAPAAFHLDDLTWTPAGFPGPVADPDPATPLRTPPGVVFHGVSDDNIATFETASGRGLAVDHWFESWAANYTTGFNTTKANSVHNAGRVNFIAWQPMETAGGATQPTYTLTSIIDGTHDAHIDAWAQGCKTFGHPIFLRFAPEMNGDWLPWSEQTNGNTAGQYVLAWRHVWSRFAAAQVPNVTWVWCPNRPYIGATPLGGLYPGDNYVDWLAIDAYNFGSDQPATGWRSVAEVFDSTFAELRAVTAAAKPVMIAETGSSENGGDKAAWITDLFARLASDYPYVAGVCYFNHDKSTTTSNWRIQTSTAATNAYAAGVANARYAPRRRPAFPILADLSAAGFTETVDTESTSASANNVAIGLHYKTVAAATGDTYGDTYGDVYNAEGGGGGASATGTQQVTSTDTTAQTWAGVGFLIQPKAGTATPTVVTATATSGFSFGGTASASVIGGAPAPVVPNQGLFDGIRWPRISVKAATGPALEEITIDSAGRYAVRSLARSGFGKNSPIDSASPATVTIVFNNSSGDYDPGNPASPFYPLLTLGCRVEIAAQWPASRSWPRLAGEILDFSLDVGLDPTVTITVADGLARLGRTQLSLETQAQFGGQRTGARINTLADKAGWPASDRAIDTGSDELLPTLLGEPALELMRQVELTEFGWLFVNETGDLVFYDRHRTSTASRSVTVQATLSDTGVAGSFGMMELSFARTTGEVYNDIHLTRDPDPTQDPDLTGSEPGDVPTEQVATDTASTALHGALNLPAEVGKLHRSDAAVLAMAQGLLEWYANPTDRIEQVRLTAIKSEYTSAAAGDLWATLLGLSVLDRITVSRNYGPRTISKQLLIARIDEEITADPPGWVLTLTTINPPPAANLFIIGTSLIGSGRLGW